MSQDQLSDLQPSDSSQDKGHSKAQSVQDHIDTTIRRLQHHTITTGYYLDHKLQTKYRLEATQDLVDYVHHRERKAAEQAYNHAKLTVAITWLYRIKAHALSETSAKQLLKYSGKWLKIYKKRLAGLTKGDTE